MKSKKIFIVLMTLIVVVIVSTFLHYKNMNYISENVAVAGQSGVIERRNFYQVFISLSLLFNEIINFTLTAVQR
mgnify:CR=1 FL=1